MHTTNDIRRAFLDFFKQRDHTVVASSPLVPHHDPTLMFTNAGMVPFKDVFTQKETRDYVRAASSQKCVRAGGKHNDLDNVGYTARHHTFFEMLGNFSFGDYFKEQAIINAWDLLTNVFELPKEKLLVTVYHTDDVAFELWKKIAGLPEERIIRIATNDNFWSMGATGPCGPCSEIFYDHGPEIAGGPPGSPDEDGDRFIEIWNLVFMQHDALADGTRINLPAPSIDTGMGLERLAAVLQGKHDNYDIDLFESLIATSQELSGNASTDHLVSHRVIADHLRSSSFLLADGVMPSNEGRGYVLRRIMRRAMRHIHQLGCKEPLMHRLVPSLIDQMGQAYPELVRAQSLIEQTLELEEGNFNTTLDRGLKLLNEELQHLSAGGCLQGDVAFKLYDTYGFPFDLTVDILRGKNISVDETGFAASMDEQKKRARAAWAGSGEQATDQVWQEIHHNVGGSEFVGYHTNEAEGQVVALVQDGVQVKSISAGQTGAIILNQTPFYGESGGQIGDTGLLTADGIKAIVTSTQKPTGSLIVHHITLEKGDISLGQILNGTIDAQRRESIGHHHSATHLLHAALREMIGDHVTQKGSFVAPDRLRFDFSHPKALTGDQTRSVTDRVNAIIRQNSPARTRLMNHQEAIDAGAMALFGEKYGDQVRVLDMGYNENQSPFSIELCGGTHVQRTGDIGSFVIISESALASGIRRIEALAGKAASDYLLHQNQLLSDVANGLKITPADLPARIEALLTERKTLEKALKEAKNHAAMGASGPCGASMTPQMIGDIPFIGQVCQDVDAKSLREMVITLAKQPTTHEGVVALVGTDNGKVSVIIAVEKSLTNRVTAPTLVKAAGEHVGAKGGGGKPDFAQTGGDNISGAQAALDAIESMLKGL